MKELNAKRSHLMRLFRIRNKMTALCSGSESGKERKMITIFNRAVLFQDSDAVASAKVWSTLEKNNIEYEMKTIKDHTTFGRNLHYSQSMSIGAGGLGGRPFGDKMNYVYVIYVKKSDLSSAKKVCGL